MSVYVDRLRKVERTDRWPFLTACHMTADSLEELHLFAGEIGLHRDWFQNKSFPRYDLTHTMRLKAVQEGAIEV